MYIIKIIYTTKKIEEIRINYFFQQFIILHIITTLIYRIKLHYT